MTIPTWKLPPGVSRGTWDYLQSPHIASDYDRYFADHPLLRLDIAEVIKRLPPLDRQPPASPPPLVADLGCGTGRVSRALSPLGFRLLNVDLSEHMLDQLMQQSQHPAQNACLRANLVELDCLEPASLDMAVCLFSSIGMIRGRQHRQRFVAAVYRALKPGAEFFLHAHNRYHSLWDPSGPAWLAHTRWKSWTNRDWEFGDRVYSYRGLPAMFLHIYSRGELRHDLRKAGFERLEFMAINRTGDALLKRRPWNALRAGGYFVAARRNISPS
ncbi:MAG: class I SAM-dependent methyltransferase [Pirellulaceae bacterium]